MLCNRNVEYESSIRMLKMVSVPVKGDVGFSQEKNEKQPHQLREEQMKDSYNERRQRADLKPLALCLMNP